MGITGLLPALKQIQDPTTLARYKGKTLAIDTYSWLHKSIMTCTMELAQDRPTTKYVNYVMRKIDMLQHFGITPYLVFDGDYLPCKKNTELDRESRRNQYKKQGLSALERGDSKLAYSCFQKSCDITPSMAKALIDVLRRKNIKYVVAPYEADSQMVYLERMGIVDGIISEDSDLLIFGCSRLITKLNDKGECVEINKENFKKCRQVPVHYLTQEQLRMVAALSGCDYTKGVAGIGIIKAFGLIKRYGSMEKTLAAMKLEGKYRIPEGFMQEYERANIAFQYQLVFDPIQNRPTNLSEIPETVPPMLRSYSGERFEDDVHRQIARGVLHPVDKVPLLSREETLTSSTAQRSLTLLRGLPERSNGYTPVKMASRAYSTPVSSAVPAKRTIDTFFTPKPVQESVLTPDSTSKRILLADTKQKQTQASPTSKRKKMLLGDVDPNTSFRPSKFFAKSSVKSVQATSVKSEESVKKTEVVTKIEETQELSDVDADHLSSSAETSLIEDQESSRIEENTFAEIEERKTTVLPHGTNSSDFDIEELSDAEGGEGQVLMTQTECSSDEFSSQSILKSITDKIGPTTVLNENAHEEAIDQVRQGLRKKFGLQNGNDSDAKQRPITSKKREVLQNVAPTALNRQRDEKSAYNSLSLPKTTKKISKTGPRSTLITTGGKLNLDSFIFRE